MAQIQISLSWTPPTTRVDGTDLDAIEIASYWLDWSSSDGAASGRIVVPGDQISTQFFIDLEPVDVNPGLVTLNISVTAVDADGRESLPSEVKSGPFLLRPPEPAVVAAPSSVSNITGSIICSDDCVLINGEDEIVAEISIPGYVVSVPGANANLIYSENFEDNSFEDTYGTNASEYWDILTASSATTTNNPHSGTYCFRTSLSETSALDDITSLPGVANAHCNIGFGAQTYGNTSDFDISDINTGEVCIEWWVRFDSGELANLLDDTHKMAYIYTTVPDNYFIISIRDDARLTLFVNADNTAGYPYTAGDTPPNFQYGYNIGSYPDDGDWHNLKFWVKYGTGGGSDTSIKVLIDDVEHLSVTDAVAIYTTGDKVVGCVIPSNLSNAGTTVTTVGIQIDDIQIWDGLP